MAQVDSLPKITLDDVREMGERAKGSINRLYIHWSAGRYSQFFDDYHILVDGDGSIYKSTDDLTERLNHTYRRNSNAVGIGMMCCLNATPEAAAAGDFGEFPPTPEQIDATAKVIAVLCQALGLDIVKDNVMTHNEIANIDGYGLGQDSDCRWDLLYLLDFPSGNITDGGVVIRGKAEYWKKQGVK